MKSRVELPVGEGMSCALELPPGWMVQEVLQNRKVESIDLAEALREGLTSPIGAASPLCRDYKDRDICIVVDDETRPTPVDAIFPRLWDFLRGSGAESERTTVLVAAGAHAPMSREAICRRLGVSDPEGMRLVCHDCRDEAALKDLGRTPSGMPIRINGAVVMADFVFSIGTIEPHIMAGFGGGYKNIVPGCAGLETVAATHLLGPAMERFGNVGRHAASCPVRLRIDEAASAAVKNCFIVNTVLDASHGIAGLFCGDPLEAHRMGCLLAERVWGGKLSARGDVLLGSSSPMVHDLCQASKALSMGAGALREGGIILMVLCCRNGLGDYCVSPTARNYEENRRIIRSYGTEYYLERKREELGGASLPFYESFLTQSNAEALRKADIFVHSPDIPADELNAFGLFRAFVSVGAMLEEAGRCFPRASVVLSPHSGACYPRLSPPA